MLDLYTNLTCYWLRYTDLQHLNMKSLYDHYESYGRKEGRKLSCNSVPKHKLYAITNLLEQSQMQKAKQRLEQFSNDDALLELACYFLRYKDLRHLTLDQLKKHLETEGRETSCIGFTIESINYVYKKFELEDTHIDPDSIYTGGSRTHSVIYGALSNNQCGNRNHVDVDLYFENHIENGAVSMVFATLGLFEKMVNQFPWASVYVKVDCDTVIRNQYDLSLYLEHQSFLYWGSCANTLKGLKIDGKDYNYAQGGLYALSAKVVKNVLKEANRITNDPKLTQIVGNGLNEDSLIGAACQRLSIDLQCAGWIISSFGRNKNSPVYHPDLPKCSLAESDDNKRLKSIDFVITACRGSCFSVRQAIRWYKRQNFDVHVYLYQKCGYNHECMKMFRLKTASFYNKRLSNTGRCDHTMSYFLSEHYNTLSDMIFFLKDTMSMWNFPMLKYSHMLDSTRIYGIGCATPLYRETISSLKSYLPTSYNSPSIHFSEKNDEIPFSSMSWEQFLIMYNISVDSTMNVCYGGSFAVKRNIILKHSQSFYQRLTNGLSRGNNIIESHYMERLWAHIFTTNYRSHCPSSRCKVCTYELSKSMFCKGEDFLNVNGCL